MPCDPPVPHPSPLLQYGGTPLDCAQMGGMESALLRADPRVAAALSETGEAWAWAESSSVRAVSEA